MANTVLILAESPAFRDELASRVRRSGLHVQLVADAEHAVAATRSMPVQALIVEKSESIPVLQLRERIRSHSPGTQVVLLESFERGRSDGTLLCHGHGDFIASADELAAWLESRRPDAGRDEERIKSLIQVIDVLVGLLEADDPHFGGFSHQVAKLSRLVALELGLEQPKAEEVAIAAMLRDLGKSGVKRDVLIEQEEYDEAQTREMREHVNWSVRLLEHLDAGWKILPIVRHHHERYDGAGYPDGLRGREIPLGARIIAAVEAYAAMVSDRPHRPARSFDDALDELMSQAGSQFDPEIVEVLVNVLDDRRPAGLMGGKPLVVIVDPEAEFRRLLRMRLLNHGFEARGIARMAGTLAEVVGRVPDLLLVDSGESGDDAFNLLRLLRDDEVAKKIPFGILARRDDRDQRLKALRLGVDDYILKNNDLEEVSARVENILTREALRRRSEQGPRERGVKGRLENLNVTDIVQMLSMGSKTACVTVDAIAASGKIWFREGTIVHAEGPGVEGEEAFYRLMPLTQGDFTIHHGQRSRTTSIEHDAMYLLMEGTRRVDEASSPSAPLEIDTDKLPRPPESSDGQGPRIRR